MPSKIISNITQYKIHSTQYTLHGQWTVCYNKQIDIVKAHTKTHKYEGGRRMRKNLSGDYPHQPHLPSQLKLKDKIDNRPKDFTGTISGARSRSY